MRAKIIIASMLLIYCQCSFAQHNDWTIYLSNKEKLSDVSFLSLNRDSLFITSSGEMVWVPFSSIEKIQRRESPPKTAIGLLAGGAVGAGLGYLAGSALTGSKSNSGFTSIETSDSKGLYALLGGLLGAGIGAGIGGSSGMLKYDLRGKMNNEKIALMQSILIEERTPRFVQPPTQDVVYLKNGGSVTGLIVDQASDSTLTIQFGDSSKLVYKMSEVISVSKKSVVPQASKSLGTMGETYTSSSSTEDHKTIFTFNAGFSLPSSPSSFTTYWKPGFNLGAGLGSGLSSSVSMFTTIDYNNYPFDSEKFLQDAGVAGTGTRVDGGTISIFTITGNVRVLLGTPNTVAPYIVAGAGFFSMSESDVTISGPSGYIKYIFKSETAFSVLPGIGLEIPMDQTTKLFLQISYGFGFTSGQSTGYIPVKIGVVTGF